jgi:hypothetical protein
MTNTLRIIKAVIMLVIAAFIIMVIVGVYTALDAAPSYSLATSANALSADSDGVELAAASALAKEIDSGVADGAADAAAPSALSANNGESGVAASSPSTVAPAGSVGSSNGGSAAGSSGGSNSSSGGGSNNAGGSSGTGGSNATTPAPSTPAKTYHPAWDEWVESGYYETRTIPASFGQRDTFGSVCNDCGADISGHAAQHLKDTHHSGYHEGIVGSETYEITPARTEQVWIDTSHWVHHEAYYD